MYLFLFLILSCSRDPRFIDETGRLSQADMLWLERSVDEFTELTDRSWLRMHRVVVREQVSGDPGALGYYTTIGVNRIEVQESSVLARDRYTLWHELCHALDATEGISRRAKERFGEEQLDGWSNYAIPPLHPEQEIFALLCGAGPRDPVTLWAQDSCGEGADPTQSFLATEVWRGAPKVESADLEISFEEWGPVPFDPSEVRAVAPYGAGELWLREDGALWTYTDQGVAEIGQAQDGRSLVPMSDGGVLISSPSQVERLYADGRREPFELNGVVGAEMAVLLPDTVLVNQDHELLVFNLEGELIEPPWLDQAQYLPSSNFTYTLNSGAGGLAVMVGYREWLLLSEDSWEVLSAPTDSYGMARVEGGYLQNWIGYVDDEPRSGLVLLEQDGGLRVQRDCEAGEAALTERAGRAAVWRWPERTVAWVIVE